MSSRRCWSVSVSPTADTSPSLRSLPEVRARHARRNGSFSTKPTSAVAVVFTIYFMKYVASAEFR